MKYFIAIALIAAVASARVIINNDSLGLSDSQMAEVYEILAAIHSPSTDPATAVMLEQMLNNILGVSPVQPPVILPAIIDEVQPVHIGPEIIDFPLPEGALAPVKPTPVAPEAPVAPVPSSSPLVQIVVNVNKQGDVISPSPVQVDQVGTHPSVVIDHPQLPEIQPTPVMVVEEAFVPEIHPTPVAVVEEAFVPEIAPTPVVVVEQPEIKPDPVIVAPIIVAPAVIAPDTLN